MQTLTELALKSIEVRLSFKVPLEIRKTRYWPISQNDTQLVSIMYRTHKSLPIANKVSSLYAFDSLARAARGKVTKHNLTGDINSEKGNCATFLLKIEGVLDGLFQDMTKSEIPEGKVSYLLTRSTRIACCLLYWYNRCSKRARCSTQCTARSLSTRKCCSSDSLTKRSYLRVTITWLSCICPIKDS